MSAKESAILDIQEECKRQNKTFIPFVLTLDPVMQGLVHSQIVEQTKHKRPRRKGYRVATCFLIKSKPIYINHER